MSRHTTLDKRCILDGIRIKYGEKANNGAIIITTKKFAVSSYKAKLSSFSKKYKEYIEHQNNDDDVSYVLNGVFLSVKPGERIKALYEIPANKIRSVYFMENEYYNGGDSRKYNVIITTKK